MKRLISILLAVLMILSVVPVSISVSATDFTEVDGYYTNAPCEYNGIAITDFGLSGTSYLKFTVTNNNSYAISDYSAIYYKAYDENDIIISNSLWLTESLNPGESQYKTIYISGKVKKIEFIDVKAVEEETRIDPEFSTVNGYIVNSLPFEMNGVEVTDLVYNDFTGASNIALVIKNNNSYAISDSSKIYYRLYDESGILVKTGISWLKKLNAGESCYFKINGAQKFSKIIVTEISTNKTTDLEYPETEITNNIETNILPANIDGISVNDIKVDTNSVFYAFKVSLTNVSDNAISSNSKLYYRTFDENNILIDDSYCNLEHVNADESLYTDIYTDKITKKIVFYKAVLSVDDPYVLPETEEVDGYTLNKVGDSFSGLTINSECKDTDSYFYNTIEYIIANNTEKAISNRSKIYYRIYDKNDYLIKDTYTYLQAANNGESQYFSIIGGKNATKIIIYKADIVEDTTVDHVHQITTVSAKDPTCTEDGLTEGTVCSVCGTKLNPQIAVPALGHTPSDEAAITEPTCTEKGVKTYMCTVCGEVAKTEEIPALGHDEIQHEGKVATCIESGYEAYVTCSRCDYSTYKEIPAFGHTEETILVVAPTCTTTGLTEGKKCSVCGEILTAQEVAPALGHSFTNYVSNGDATCTADGTKTAKCDRCDVTDTITDEGSKLGHSFTNYVSNGDATCTADGTKTAKCDRCDATDTITDEDSKLGHTEEIISAVAPTCTTTGLTEGNKCSVCGEILTAQEVVPATGHTSNEGTLTREPSCTVNGIVKYMCTVCGTVIRTETLSATGHIIDAGEVTTEPTCTTAGTKTFRCTICDAVIRTTTIPALGHNEIQYDGKTATCTEAGYEAYVTCSRCDYSTYKEIPALGHTEETVPAVAATCITTGLTEGKKCSVCGEILTAQEVVPTTGHTEETIPAVAPTCTKSGLTEGIKCSVCGEIIKAQTKTLAQGTGLKSGTVNTTSITLEWTAVNGAKYYRLQQYNLSTKKWVTLTTTTAINYTVSNLSAVTAYQFRVTPLDSTKKIAGEASDPLTVTTACTAPTIKLTSTEANTAVVTVTEVTGAKSYIIYMSTDGKRWIRVTTITDTTYTFVGLTAGKKIYVMAAANNADDITTSSPAAAITVSKNHTPNEGTITTPATCTEKGVKTYMCTVCGEITNTEEIPALGHKAVTDKAIAATCTTAGKTEGSHCSVCNAVIKAQTTVPATGHTIVALKARTATVKQSGLTAGSKCSVCGEVLKAQTMTLAQGTGLKASTVKTTSITLKWTAINGAKYYKIEQYNASTKKWTAIKTTTATSYTVSKLGAGTTYKFRVTALDSTKKIAGKASAVLTATTICAAPTIKLTSTKSKTATVTITKVTGAKSYTIYKSTDGKKWTSVTTTTKTSYNLSSLTAGKKIYVKVLANNADGKASAYSKVASVTVKK